MPIQERSLFTGERTPETNERNPIRPLGPLSDYVVEGLPQDLANVRRGFYRSAAVIDMLSERTEELLRSSGQQLAHIEASDDSRLRDLALLDLILLNTVIVKSKGMPPGELTEVVKRQSAAAGRIPWITYEDLVLVNPIESDPRVLLEGESGQTEVDFYVTHARIEFHLDRQIAAMQEAQDVLITDSDPEAAAGILSAAELSDDREQVAQLVIDVGHKLHKPTFDTFNPYFFSTKDFKGPSGAFSAGIPIIEILLAGDIMPDDRLFYNSTFRDYFPRKGRALMDEGMQAAAEGNSLLQGFTRTGENPNLKAELIRIDKFLQVFRGHHMKAVRNKAPETLTGERPGSAGTIETEKFLLDRSRFRYIE